jgi:hypothetical protein
MKINMTIGEFSFCASRALEMVDSDRPYTFTCHIVEKCFKNDNIDKLYARFIRPIQKKYRRRPKLTGPQEYHTLDTDRDGDDLNAHQVMIKRQWVLAMFIQEILDCGEFKRGK